MVAKRFSKQKSPNQLHCKKDPHNNNATFCNCITVHCSLEFITFGRNLLFSSFKLEDMSLCFKKKYFFLNIYHASEISFLKIDFLNILSSPLLTGWPDIHGRVFLVVVGVVSLLKVTCPVYACTVAYTGQVTF